MEIVNLKKEYKNILIKTQEDLRQIRIKLEDAKTLNKKMFIQLRAFEFMNKKLTIQIKEQGFQLKEQAVTIEDLKDKLDSAETTIDKLREIQETIIELTRKAQKENKLLRKKYKEQGYEKFKKESMHLVREHAKTLFLKRDCYKIQKKLLNREGLDDFIYSKVPDNLSIVMKNSTSERLCIVFGDYCAADAFVGGLNG
jgi:hypothetical protein